MPTAPSASWVAECAACHHSNPARAHFCSVCGAPLHSPAAAAAAATAAAKASSAAPSAEAAPGEQPEPKGFMLHFNDDNTLAIAPRYTSPDPGDAESAPAAASMEHPAAAAVPASGHADFHFSLPGPQHRQEPPAALPLAGRAGRPSTTVVGAMLALTALVATGSYLLGRSTAPVAQATAPMTVQPTAATAAALNTAPAPVTQQLATAPAAPALPATATLPPTATGQGQVQQAVAPMAPALPSRQVAEASVTRAAPATPAAPVALPAARAPAATPCNATVAALGLCEP
ncbi:hypothetical protein [Azohydromonas caseinilytica]|uniref:Zinc-ribbon domain-containing protein n=1 Tax=Azohydromonas caseinilytica TaxID=2728836 RepID=A0A848F1Q7_9BURK|nr:hypothetical protein [Azohydromonas caseinilytica]NML14007.1 hypothetical protein [Azohydromonas caseinilytica]